jgi:ankyrin repeat protein
MCHQRWGGYLLRVSAGVVLCGITAALPWLPRVETPSPTSQLCSAASAGDIGQIDRALAHGALINGHDETGQTPLMLAAGAGRRDVVLRLLARGADVNARAPYYGSALMAASCNGQAQVIPPLLAYGADAKMVNEFGNDALWLAAAGDHQDAVHLLLASGADIDRTGAGGLTPRKLLGAVHSVGS